ncbi:MAG: hypothetical protein KJ668_11870, partial [Proteobacteria bacterium]|nr:hypothetical protein [Pseudomonadota bacterium]
MNHTKPIIFCEEFACTEPTELKNNLNKAPKKNDYPINSNLKGVCNNCENIETCHLQKTDCT